MKLVKYTFIVSLVFISALANAHSELKSSFPKNGQQLTNAPEHLKLTFSEMVKLTQVEIFDQTDAQVKMAFMLSPRASEQFEIPLSSIKQGSYTVKWQAVAGSTKKMKGEFTFSLNKSIALDKNNKAHKTSHSDKPNKFFVNHNSAPGKVVTQFHKALRSGDKVLARSLLADDVLIYEGGGVERSAEQYANHHMLSDMKYLKNISSKQLEHIVIVSGKTAVSNSRSHSTGKFKGKDINRSGMETIVLKEINGNWKIIRIHWS